MRRLNGRRAVALTGSALLVPVLGACATHTDPPATVEDPNGPQVVDAVIVTGSGEDQRAAFLGTVGNTSNASSQVVSIEAAGQSAAISPTTFAVEPNRSILVQTGQDVTANFSNFTAETGTYIPVTIGLKSGGKTTVDVLVVPPVKAYATAAPPDTNPVSTASPEPVEVPPKALTAQEEHDAVPHGH